MISLRKPIKQIPAQNQQWKHREKGEICSKLTIKKKRRQQYE